MSKEKKTKGKDISPKIDLNQLHSINIVQKQIDAFKKSETEAMSMYTLATSIKQELLDILELEPHFITMAFDKLTEEHGYDKLLKILALIESSNENRLKGILQKYTSYISSKKPPQNSINTKETNTQESDNPQVYQKLMRVKSYNESKIDTPSKNEEESLTQSSITDESEAPNKEKEESVSKIDTYQNLDVLKIDTPSKNEKENLTQSGINTESATPNQEKEQSVSKTDTYQNLIRIKNYNVSKIDTKSVSKIDTYQNLGVLKIDTYQFLKTVTENIILLSSFFIKATELIVTDKEFGHIDERILLLLLYSGNQGNKLGIRKIGEQIGAAVMTTHKSVLKISDLLGISLHPSDNRFMDIITSIYNRYPALNEVTPMLQIKEILQELINKNNKIADNVCMYIYNNIYNNTNIHTYVSDTNENDSQQAKMEQLVKKHLEDFLFKAVLLGINLNELSNVALEKIKQIFTSGDFEKPNWKFEMKLQNDSKNLLKAAYYTLQQKDIKRPWKYLLKIYEEKLYENLTNEQATALEKLIKHIDEIQNEETIYSLSTKELLEILKQLNIPQNVYGSATPKQLREKTINYINRLKQNVKIYTLKS